MVRGGAGDDRISVTSLDFAHIAGGTGTDTLVLDGSGLSLDLTGAGTAGVDSVEILDLSGTGADTLVLDALAVSDLTEERDGGMATLDVRGDADDTVELRGFVFSSTETEAGATYNVYRDGNAQVRVQDGLVVKLTPVFTSASVASVAENTAAGSRVYTAMARDADGDALIYSLSGTDAGLFTIDEGSGEVRFRAAPDYENPADDDGDNVYRVTVTASDGDGNRTGHEVVITVTDDTEENQNPAEEVALSALDGTSGFTLTGIDLNDYAGVAISSAGDVNGDGYDDLIIGAPRADPNRDRSGETYVVYGGASAPGTDGVLALSRR